MSSLAAAVSDDVQGRHAHAGQVRSHLEGVLVTGTHRSGSTWLGRCLCISPSFGYIHEPFNPRTRPGNCSARFRHWFTHVGTANAHLYAESLRQTLSFGYDLGAEMSSVRNGRDVLRMARDCSRATYGRWKGLRPVMKDPIAFFSAPWLSEHFNLDVIMLARHPAAFVASLKRAGWHFPFSHFLEQPSLMQDLLPYEKEIRALAREPATIVEQGILLWNIFHYRMNAWKEQRPEWIFLRHEDLSQNPSTEIPRLVRRLGGTWSSREDVRLRTFIHGTGAVPMQSNTYELRRDSRKIVSSWKSLLTPLEIERVRSATVHVANEFYPEATWLVE